MIPVRDLNLREADDEEIFLAARKINGVIISKDADFVELLERNGSPPKLIWLTCGNTSEARLKEIFSVRFSAAMELLRAGNDLVEISD